MTIKNNYHLDYLDNIDNEWKSRVIEFSTLTVAKIMAINYLLDEKGKCVEIYDNDNLDRIFQINFRDLYLE